MAGEQAGAIIVAAGRGLRMGPSTGPLKQYRELAGAPVLIRTLEVFEHVDEVEEIVIVLPADDVKWVSARWLQDRQSGKRIRVVPGGASRQESVSQGRLSLSSACRWIVVHDGVRPLCTPDLVSRVLLEARQTGAAIAALPVTDTIKRVDDQGRVSETLQRDSLWSVQTPQVFRHDLLAQAHGQGSALGTVTDDASLVERLGVEVRVVRGEETNIKLTREADFRLAEAIVTARQRGPTRSRTRGPALGSTTKETEATESPSHAPIRVGYGFDVHRLGPGRKLILGGVKIPFESGLYGHSDADVLAHAVTDAILGAAGMGDIGRHFPDSDEKYRGADSIRLLEEAVRRIRARGWAVAQIDATVVAEKPKLASFIPAIQARLADALGVQEDAVNVKATTSERLGFTGRAEGMAAHAVATVMRRSG